MEKKVACDRNKKQAEITSDIFLETRVIQQKQKKDADSDAGGYSEKINKIGERKIN